MRCASDRLECPCTINVCITARSYAVRHVIVRIIYTVTVGDDRGRINEILDRSLYTSINNENRKIIIKTGNTNPRVLLQAFKFSITEVMRNKVYYDNEDREKSDKHPL